MAMRDVYDTPDHAQLDDRIVNGTYEPLPGEPHPIALFKAARVDFSLHRHDIAPSDLYVPPSLPLRTIYDTLSQYEKRPVRALRRRAGPTVEFTGRVPDATVAEIMQGARALIVTSVEEFGIAEVEVQAAGRPVIARHGGGALETVVDGVTGCFWSGEATELTEAVLSFDDGAIDPGACVANAARFDASRFRSGIREQVATAHAKATEPWRETARPPAPSRPLLRRAVRDAHG